MNPTGTACHLSIALAVIAYGLDPIREALIQLAVCVNDTKTATEKCANHVRWMRELGKFLQEWTRMETAEGFNTTAETEDYVEEQSRQLLDPIDPSPLYRAMQKLPQQLTIEPNELGDAVTALVKVLQSIRQGVAAVEPPSVQVLLQELLTVTVDGGLTHSVITGMRKVVRKDPPLDKNPREEHSTSNKHQQLSSLPTTVREKLLKRRPMMCPFHVGNQGPGASSLSEALRQAVSPQKLEEYQWRATASVSYREYLVEDDTSLTEYDWPIDSDGWSTGKKLCIDQLPGLWLIHVDCIRGLKKDDSEKTAWNSQMSLMEIPLKLDARSLVEPPIPENGDRSCSLDDKDYQADPSRTCLDYDFVGGILHVQEKDNGETLASQEDDVENGHYMAVVNYNEDWFLIDDEDCVAITKHMCYTMLSGCCGDAICNDDSENDDDNPFWSTKSGQRLQGTYICGSLLVYRRRDLSEIATPILSKLHLELSRACDEVAIQPQEQWLGRRLRVQWAGGKFYAGVITSYDPETGKHQVTYEDGDVRTYRLDKKTIQWLN